MLAIAVCVLSRAAAAKEKMPLAERWFLTDELVEGVLEW